MSSPDMMSIIVNGVYTKTLGTCAHCKREIAESRSTRTSVCCIRCYKNIIRHVIETAQADDKYEDKQCAICHGDGSGHYTPDKLPVCNECIEKHRSLKHMEFVMFMERQAPERMRQNMFWG